MQHKNVPLIEAIKEHQQKSKASFHVPGHKNGLYFHESLHNDFRNVLPYDVTELEGLDDLHDPSGPIKDAQRKAAQLYGAEETFFLVGGTTVGNLVMVYALFEPGDVVFIQRNSHKSVFHAAQIAGVTPILLTPEYDAVSGLPMGINSETLQKAIALYPEAKGLLLTYPNYFGVSIDVLPTIELAKQHDLLVLVDEAHAPHYCLGRPFPPSTLALGADAVVQSAHKMLPALTMSSFLHIGSALSNDQQQCLKEALTMFQSSSPSYLLMASLDGARAYVDSLDDQILKRILEGVEELKQELATIGQIKVVNWDEERYHSDPLKVTIKSITTLTGYELQKLFCEVGLFPEMADEKHVLLVLGLGTSSMGKDAFERLKELLSPYQIVAEKYDRLLTRQENEIRKLHVFPSKIRSLPKKAVPLSDANGLIAAETLIPYPPGVPLVLAGEKINQGLLMKIEKLKQAGARFQGHEEGFETVFVIDSEEKE